MAVQVQSAADAAVFRKYARIFADMQGFSRFYFVTHSPTDALSKEAVKLVGSELVLWDARQLARMATRVGLTGWLLDKAS